MIKNCCTFRGPVRPRPRHSVVWTLAAALCVFLTVCPPVAAAQRQFLKGHVPAAVNNTLPVGDLPASTRLNLAIGLPLRNRETLTNLLQELYDPADPHYHHYLTPDQFTEMFGPTEQDYQAVIAFAQANGLVVRGTHPNRTILDVSGTTSQVEKVLHVKMHTYQHPTEPRLFRAPDVEPSLDLDVPILHISGLDDYVVPHPLLTRGSPMNNAAPHAGSGPNGEYRGADFRAAYAPGVQLTGTGQSVGLFELDGYFANDITTYESQAGIADVPLQNILVDNVSGNPSGNANAVAEVSLDIEMAISMAPGISNVLVYEGINNDNITDPNDVLNRMATDDIAKELSCSWGFSIDSTTEQIFQEYGTHGQSFFLASGDSGAYVGAIPQPSDDPYVTVVGGTTLSTTGPGGSWTSETVWNWYTTGLGTAASSGGISTTYSIPSWQAPVSMASNQGNSTQRNIPDVALTADAVYVIYDSGSSGYFGGTSCAAPLWAGFTALVNEQAVSGGNPTVGFLNPALYAIGTGPNYLADFHDITTGNNTNPSSPVLFTAVAGFDLCTGWGTPNGSNLINALAPLPNTPIVVSAGSALVAESCLPTNGLIDPGETVTVNFLLQNVGQVSTTNLVATLQPGGGVTLPSGPQGYGALTSGGGAVGRTFTFTASGSCGGSVTATLQLQDGSTGLGAVNFVFPLGKFVNATTFTQNFDGVTAPTLPSGWSTETTGAQVPWVTSTAAHDTAPNAAFASGPAAAGIAGLISPLIPIASSSATMTFRNNYNLQASTHNNSTADDGGVLEISIGGGAFADILSAGGSFAAGGYNRTISTTRGSPLPGRKCWSGNSGGFITTTVNLPAAAAGKNIQLKWRCATDNSGSSAGWYADTISVADGFYSCCTPSADLAAGQSAAPNPAVVGHPLTYTLLLTNLGPDSVSSVTLTDTLPAGVAFVSASPGLAHSGASVTGVLTALAAGASTNFTIIVTPSAAGSLTNMVTVSSALADPDLTNNTASLVLLADAIPVFTTEPTNETVVLGSNALFQTAATGTGPLGYQWFFNSTNLPGATTNTLTLTNVQAVQAGNYFLIASNLVGSATSTVAQLTVLLPPVITTQPSNQLVLPGATVSVLSAASGTAPLAYQWYFNGTNLVGATTNTLTMTNVQPAQAGGYYLVVTNLAGTATSSNAQIVVLVPPSIASAKLTSTNLSLTFSSVAGLNYTLEYKNSVLDTNWTPILPSVAGTGGTLTLKDPGPAVPARFYRISCN
jgi:uncharacterized repeat protein (TIGR01451 family)